MFTDHHRVSIDHYYTVLLYLTQQGPPFTLRYLKLLLHRQPPEIIHQHGLQKPFVACVLGC